MNLTLKSRRRRVALALAGLLILVAAILVIGGAIVIVLVKICRRCLPPTDPPPGNTNTVYSVTSEFRSDWSPTQPLVMPNFQFPELPAAPNGTPENPLGDGWIELERSTNLVDWSVILKTNLNYEFCFCDDTNAPDDRAFYRMKVVYP